MNVPGFTIFRRRVIYVYVALILANVFSFLKTLWKLLCRYLYPGHGDVSGTTGYQHVDRRLFIS